MNRKQKVAVGVFVVLFAAMVLRPPWVEVLRDDSQERHVMFLGRAPVWSPPDPTRKLEEVDPNPVRRDKDQIWTELFSTGVLLSIVLWLLRTRPPRPRVGGRRRSVDGQAAGRAGQSPP